VGWMVKRRVDSNRVRFGQNLAFGNGCAGREPPSWRLPRLKLDLPQLSQCHVRVFHRRAPPAAAM
jgi:hypothetical protein